MKELLKLLPIFATLIGAQLIFNFINYTLIYPKIKSGVYHVPLFGDFTSLTGFAAASWLIGTPGFLVGTILVAWSVRLSFFNFGVMYTSVIISQIITTISTLFFMWYRMGELPTRNGWIALVLVFLASLFAANSGRSV